MMMNFSVSTEFVNVVLDVIPSMANHAGTRMELANLTKVTLAYAGVACSDNLLDYVGDAVEVWQQIDYESQMVPYTGSGPSQIATQTVFVHLRSPDWFVILQIFVLLAWWLHSLYRLTLAVRTGADLAAAGFHGRMIKMISYPTYEEAREIFMTEDEIEKTAKEFMMKTQLSLEDAKTVDLLGWFVYYMETAAAAVAFLLVPTFMTLTSRDGATLAMCCFVIVCVVFQWLLDQYTQFVARRLDSYRNWYKSTVRPVAGAYIPVALPGKLETSFGGSSPTVDLTKKTHFMRLYTNGLINGVYTAVKDDGEVYLISTCHQVLGIVEDVQYTMETRADGRILHRVPADKWIPILSRPDLWDETTDIALWKGAPVKALCAQMQITPLELETKLNPNRESATLRLHSDVEGVTEIQHGMCLRSECKPLYFSHYMSTRPGDSGAPILSSVSGRLIGIHTGWDTMPDGNKANQAFTSFLIRLATARFNDEIPQEAIRMTESDTMFLQHKLSMVSEQLADRVLQGATADSVHDVVFKTKTSDKHVQVIETTTKGSFAVVKAEVHVPRESNLVEKTTKGLKHMTLAKAITAEQHRNATDAGLALSKIHTAEVTVKGKSVTAVASLAADFSWYARYKKIPFKWDEELYRELAKEYYADMAAKNDWAREEKKLTPAQRKEYFPLLGGKNVPDALSRKDKRVQGFELGVPDFTQFQIPTVRKMLVMTMEQTEKCYYVDLPQLFANVRSLMAHHREERHSQASRPEALRAALEWLGELRGALAYLNQLNRSRATAAEAHGSEVVREFDLAVPTNVDAYISELTTELFNADWEAVQATTAALRNSDSSAATSEKVKQMIDDQKRLENKIQSANQRVTEIEREQTALIETARDPHKQVATTQREPIDIEAVRLSYEQKLQSQVQAFEERMAKERIDHEARVQRLREESEIKIANVVKSHEQRLASLEKRENSPYDTAKLQNVYESKQVELNALRKKTEEYQLRLEEARAERDEAISRMENFKRVPHALHDPKMGSAKTAKLIAPPAHEDLKQETQKVPAPEAFKGKGFKCRHPACPDKEMAHTQRSCRLNRSSETPYWCEFKKCPLQEKHLVWMCPGNGPDVPQRYRAPMPGSTAPAVSANPSPARNPSVGAKQGVAPKTSPFNPDQEEFLQKVMQVQAGRGWGHKTVRYPKSDGQFSFLLLTDEEVAELRKRGAGQSSKTATSDQQWKAIPGHNTEKDAKISPVDPLQLYLHEHHPGTRGYQLPPSGPIASTRGIQASLRVAHPIRAGKTQESTVADVRTLLERHRRYRGAPEQDPDRFSTQYGQWNHFYECVNGINGRIRKEGASGFPECYVMSTKGQELQDPTAAWFRYRLVADQVEEAITSGLDPAMQTRPFSLDWLCGAPFMVIGKNEPHSEEKVQQGRFRVLQIGGLNDHIWLATFARSFKDTAANWFATDSAVGCDSTTEAGLSELMLHFMSAGSRLTSSDCKAYEFTVDKMGWLAFVCVCSYHNGSLEAEELDGVTDLFQFLSQHPSKLVRSALLYAMCKSNPNVVLGDGKEYEMVDHDGAPLCWRNPSGHPGTTLVSTASRQLMEITLARMAGVRNLYLITCGDDTVSNVPVEKYAENAARIGKKLTDVLHCTSHIEFMGYRFKFQGPHQYDRVDKALISYLHSSRNAAQESALRLVLGKELADKVITLGRQPPCDRPGAPEAVEREKETQSEMYTAKIATHMTDLTEQDRNYLRTALCDPNLKTPTGIPDKVNDYTVLKKVSVTDNIDFATQGSNNQLTIVMWPWIRKQTLVLGEMVRECEFSHGEPLQEIFVGGTGIYVTQDDKSPFADTTADGTFQMPANGPAGVGGNFGQVQTISDEFLGGLVRIVGCCVKVVSRGSEAYQSGSVRAWEQSFTPSEGFVLSNQISRNLQPNEASDVAASHVRRPFWSSVYPQPPNSSEEIVNLRRTKQVGKAVDGLYLIGEYNHTDDCTMAPVLRNIVLDDGMSALTRPTTSISNSVNFGYDWETAHERQAWASGPIVADVIDNKYVYPGGTPEQNAEESVRGYPCRQYFCADTKLRGATFKGLSTQEIGPAQMEITTTWYIELIPNSSDINMAVLAKPSPQYSPSALSRLSHIQSHMDFAWMAAQNGSGDITKAITKFLSTKVADTPRFDRVSKKVAKALLTTTNPIVHSIPGFTAGQVVANYADQRSRGKSASQAAKATVVPALKGAGKSYLLQQVPEMLTPRRKEYPPMPTVSQNQLRIGNTKPLTDHWAEVNSYLSLADKHAHYDFVEWQKISEWRRRHPEAFDKQYRERHRIPPPASQKKK